jgi:hypothetical protein
MKLRSGEEIIAKINGQTKDKMIIERPMTFLKRYVQDPYGKERELTVLKNWMSYTNEIITKIPKDYIATFLTPDSNVIDLYDKEKEREDNNNNPKKIVDFSKPLPPTSSEFPSEIDEMLTDTPDPNNLLDDMINIYLNMKNNNMINDYDEYMNDVDAYPFQSTPENEMDDMLPPEEEKSNMKNYITMTMFLPPESLTTLVDAGFIEMKDIENLIDALSDNESFSVDKKNNKNDNENNVNKKDKDWGNDWSDWSPDPQDYL